MNVLYLFTAIVGLAATAAGLILAHRLKKPWDTLAALLVPAGIVAAVLSALVMAVPGFFHG